MSQPDRDDSAKNAALAVRQILEEARRVVGTGPLFAERLEELGIGPEGGRYSESAISNWIKGRTMPPADVLLAAASIAGISLDERLAERPTPTASSWQEAVGAVQAELDLLRVDLIDLYGRLGFPMPRHEDARSAPARRAASSG